MKNKFLKFGLGKLFVIWILLFGSASVVFAATNIDSVNHYAWNDIIGWIDFYGTNNVNISASSLTGYANSSVGYIAFDCATSPNPPAGCSTTYSNWKVTNTAGILSGWAWNDQIGWISFNCNNIQNPCISPVYGVSISGGDFTGWAWNDVVGWISFNCGNTGTCAPNGTTYKVSIAGSGVPTQGSLTSSVFDTGSTAGVTYSTILYQVSVPLPTGTAVEFQLAVSNCANGATNAPTCDQGIGWGGSKTSGDGAFTGYDGTNSTFYKPTADNIPVALTSAYYNNKRYFMYKVFLLSDIYGLQSPQVSKVIVTWSR
ncbi:MAG: hypothetical protein M1155_01805 [Patescibacteria group bacterium]|nr:hypothetical protein [Patescibacteria group bacterium]